MEQKINVTITPAANDQWPKVINTMDEFPEGATHFVEQLNGGIIAAYFIVHTDQYNRFMQKEWEETKPGQVICFNDGDALCRWWLNPQPVKAETDTVAIEQLPIGGLFTYENRPEVYAKTTFTSGSWFKCQRAGHQGIIALELRMGAMVTPFKGTVTITVE